jgi:hypothetical protein
LGNGNVTEFFKGYIPRDYREFPLGSIPYCKPFDFPPIPRAEWKDRIDYLAEQKAKLSDLVDAQGIKPSSQGKTNYCWAHGTVNAMRVVRATNGQPHLDLSAAAVAAQVKNFRNQGGNTYQSIPWVAEHGVPTMDTWPANAIDRSLVTPEMKAEAMLNRLTEWWELDDNDFEQKATCLLSGIPVAAGYSHWSHLICDLDLVYRGSGSSIEFGVHFMNSWGATWGDYKNGRGELWGRKAVSFDQAAPRVVRVSA